MKRSTLLALAIFGLSACSDTDKQPESALLEGTYEVTRLTQYQDGQKVFDGYLPYLLSDSITVTNRVGISINKQAGGPDTYLILSHKEKSQQTGKSVVGNIGGLNITLRKVSSQRYNFYKDGSTEIGTGDGRELLIDTEDKNSDGHNMRNVLVAKKIIDKTIVL
ncbi:hypothetical protein GCM10028818_39090 [Spirosoma horti]